MSDCLVAPGTQCGSGAASMGTLMGTALDDFVGTHPDLGGLESFTRGVIAFGSVTTVPGTGANGTGPAGNVYTIAGVGGTSLVGYLVLTTANRHAALYITCN
jgi:hypothetical protein